MDTFVAIASKRDTRSYSEDEIPAEVANRILEAGPVTGNAMNRQDRRFVVLETVRERASGSVTRPSNLLGAALAIAVVTREGAFVGFDAGRVAQSMMLAAWNDGVASCPNAIADHDALAELLGLEQGESVSIILSFGYPITRRDPERRTGDEWLAAADRVGLGDIVRSV